MPAVLVLVLVLVLVQLRRVRGTQRAGDAGGREPYACPALPCPAPARSCAPVGLVEPAGALAARSQAMAPVRSGRR